MRLANYLQETKAEMKHVSWPTQKQAMWFSILVVVVSIVTSLALGLFDTIYYSILKAFFFN